MCWDYVKIEEELIEYESDVNYHQRDRLGGNVLDIVLLDNSRTMGRCDVSVTIQRVRSTLAGPETEALAYIDDPAELLALAKMALTAWQKFVRLQVANQKIEQAG